MSDGEGDEARPEGVAAEDVQRAFLRVLHKAVKDDLHHQGVEDEQEDEKPEQLGKDFGGHGRTSF